MLIVNGTKLKWWMSCHRENCHSATAGPLSLRADFPRAACWPVRCGRTEAAQGSREPGSQCLHPAWVYTLPYIDCLHIDQGEVKSPWQLTSLVAQTVKCLPTMWETRFQSLGGEDPLEKEMAPHSSTLAWKIPWTEEPGRLQSMGSLGVGHDWATSLSLSLSKCPWQLNSEHNNKAFQKGLRDCREKAWMGHTKA